MPLLHTLPLLLAILTISLPAATAADIQSFTVQRQALEEYLQLDGIIEAVQQSTVSAQTSGRVTALPFDVDDSVPAGALIVQLEDSEQQARLKQARAGLAEAQAGLTDSRQQLSRIQSLHDRKLVARQALDQARNQFNAAQARLAQAEASVDEAQKQLDYTRITAPYGGILVERHVELGESVNPGQPLLTGLSLQHLRVVLDLPQQYAGLAREQRRARVTLPNGEELETGEITFYPYADPATHTFRLRMPLTEPDGQLYPGMLVKVSVPVETREALWIPDEALFHRSELRAVFVLDENSHPRLRQIRTGVRNGKLIEVLAGLKAGERIVTRPQSVNGVTESDQESIQ
ncbi:efflux RND transporter periplasmic adaptor subunit [Marinobacterium sediminicola]|uniref:RND family efflux transporter, MFP subunit n=1 Tax=Marinobacterium sediminicola TaxID=518898 RepID=A0ABY1RW56_9GAMM|nr:efflux RND transporter periplasmic adaptor subunit [Marinobacterium sediminicola]ULG70415.1 efflux RND transporter periplasmic adaptor subunit [Marinobacterium sediminicola]SMR69422.1 RND family efflux transporter, MFP subunit [Marinobacterium sediminicola]